MGKYVLQYAPIVRTNANTNPQYVQADVQTQSQAGEAQAQVVVQAQAQAQAQVVVQAQAQAQPQAQAQAQPHLATSVPGNIQYSNYPTTYATAATNQYQSIVQAPATAQALAQSLAQALVGPTTATAQNEASGSQDNRRSIIATLSAVHPNASAIQNISRPGEEDPNGPFKTQTQIHIGESAYNGIGTGTGTGIIDNRDDEPITIDDTDDDDEIEFVKTASATNIDPDTIERIEVDSDIPKQVPPEPTTHGFVVPCDISDVVMLASSIVGQEIRVCHYRYKRKSDDDDSNNNDDDIDGKEKYNRIMNECRARSAAAALEQFTKDVILPSILSSHAASIEIDSEDSSSNENSLPGSQAQTKLNKGGEGRKRPRSSRRMTQSVYRRILIASVLSLREVIVMNGKNIFGIEQEDDDDMESYIIKIQSLATALILNAVMRLDDANTNATKTKAEKELHAGLAKEFLRTITEYDGAGEEFASCLKRIDMRAIGVTPDGKLMKKTENLVYRVAYNTARLDHPLVKKSKQSSVFGVGTPAPNAAFVSVVEQVEEPCENYARLSRMQKRIEIVNRYKQRMKKFGA